jgi:hypothetical protein
MQQHVFDNSVGAPSVLHHFLEIILQQPGEFLYLRAQLRIEISARKRLPQLLD